MANIRLHRKTGIYWYRRAVPAELRPYLPEVAGFPQKPSRTEFTRTLRTRSKAEANREAAVIDQQVAAALDAARKRVAGHATPASNGQGTPRRADIDPRIAFAALARWEVTQERDTERRMFNEPTRLMRTDADLARTKLVMALRERPFRHSKAWQRIDGFDERLAEALRSEGVPVTVDHPALERLRDDFAARWERIIALEEKIRIGLWVPDEEAATTNHAGAAASPTHTSVVGPDTL